MRFERLGERNGRAQFLGIVETLEDSFDRAALPGKFFHLFVLADGPLDEARFRSFSRRLLEAGAVFVMIIGSAVDRAHDLFDDAIIDGDFHVDEANAIRTVAFDEAHGETLENSVRFSLTEAHSTDDCERERVATLFVALGGADREERLRSIVAAECSLSA